MNKIEVNGVKLHYESVGSGPPILCIHPPLLTGDIFAYQRQQLSDAFRVISFDVRGHGQSETSQEKLTHALIAKDIIGLMDAFGLSQTYLCGYSTGGSVVLEAMLTYPARFLGGILISAMSEVSDPFNKSLIWAATAISKLRAKRLLSAAMSFGNSDRVSTFGRLYSQAVHGDWRHLHQYHEQSYRYNCTKRLQEIQTPIQLIYGQKDKSFHRYAYLLQRKLPHSTLYMIPKARHQIPTKNPLELQALIREWVLEREAARSSTQEAQRSSSHEDQAVQGQTTWSGPGAAAETGQEPSSLHSSS